MEKIETINSSQSGSSSENESISDIPRKIDITDNSPLSRGTLKLDTQQP